MAAGGLSPLADHDRADLGPRQLSQDRLSGSLLLLGAEAEEADRLARRDRSGNPQDLREARHSPARSRGAGRRRQAGRRAQDRGRRRVRLGFGRHHLPEGIEGRRRDLHADLGSDPRASRTGEEISRHGRADLGQLFRDAELGGVFRRLVRLRAAGRALPDGAVDLFPHQRAQHRPVRAHADHRRQGRLRQLPRRLHRAAARRKPVARRRRRTGHARRCRDQIFDGAELVPRQFRRRRRHLQFRHQAWRLPRQQFEDLLDPGRDRFGDHLEISELHPARRQFARRVLFDRDLERSPAGR